MGTLQGVVTSGIAEYSRGYGEDSMSSSLPLIGRDITIAFTADVTSNYTDQDMNFYPRYVVNVVEVTIGIPSPLGDFGSNQSNDDASLTGTADFTGNAANGSFYIDGFNGDPDFKQSVNFNFANATSTQGPLRGSGTASAGDYVPYTPESDYYAITFKLLSGFVTGPGSGVAPVGTPEPATWALMIIGFGAVGAAMRKRQRVALTCLSPLSASPPWPSMGTRCAAPT